MIDIKQAPSEELANIQVLFTDIDDTLSTRGKLLPGPYQALWTLHEAGLRIVIVTGRPAGWCDHIARFWPVDAVVGENGGFYFFHEGGRLHRWFRYGPVERADFRRRLDGIGRRILAEVPGCALASDQPYREYDLAVDFCEDVPALPRDAVLRIRDLFLQEGAHAKISSIHVNGWFGDFDKLTTARRCLKERFGLDLEADNAKLAFCGDSPNDEPMFQRFQISFGMANLRAYLDLIESRPAYLTGAECGEGFREVAERILEARR